MLLITNRLIVSIRGENGFIDKELSRFYFGCSSVNVTLCVITQWCCLQQLWKLLTSKTSCLLVLPIKHPSGITLTRYWTALPIQLKACSLKVTVVLAYHTFVPTIFEPIQLRSPHPIQPPNSWPAKPRGAQIHNINKQNSPVAPNHRNPSSKTDTTLTTPLLAFPFV